MAPVPIQGVQINLFSYLNIHINVPDISIIYRIIYAHLYYTYIFDLYGKNCTSQATKRRTANIDVPKKLRNDKFTTKAFYKIDPTAGRCITGCSRLRSHRSQF